MRRGCWLDGIAIVNLSGSMAVQGACPEKSSTGLGSVHSVVRIICNQTRGQDTADRDEESGNQPALLRTDEVVHALWYCPGQCQDDQYEKQQTQAAAGVVPPAGAVRPGRQSAHDQQNQQNQQDQVHFRLPRWM